MIPNPGNSFSALIDKQKLWFGKVSNSFIEVSFYFSLISNNKVPERQTSSSNVLVEIA